MKAVFKEIILILLLLLAIVLVLGVFLYDYIPTNKVVPKIEQYQMPNTIREELDETINDLSENKTEIVYEINGADLDNYEKQKEYQKGKANPFGSASEPNTNNEGSSNNNTDNTDNTNDNSGDNNNNSNTNTVEEQPQKNPDSVGNYLPQTGTK